jgi:hypothetical protein
MYSVFRLPARRTGLSGGAPPLVSAPVNEKRVARKRSPPPPLLWAWNAAGFSLGVPLRRSTRRLGVICHHDPASERRLSSGLDRSDPVWRRLRTSRHERLHPNAGGHSASCDWNADPASWCVRNRKADFGPCDAVGHHRNAGVAVRASAQRLPGQRFETVTVVIGRLDHWSGRHHRE